MTIPPKGDPRRPVVLSVRLMRLLAIIYLTLAGVMLLPMLLVRRVAGPPRWAALVVVVIPLAPAICYLVSAIFVRRRKAWGIVLGLVAAGINGLFLLATLTWIIVIAAVERENAIVMILPIGLELLFLIALAQLIFQLARSFEGIRHAPPDQPQGFELLGVGQSIPTAHRADARVAP